MRIDVMSRLGAKEYASRTHAETSVIISINSVFEDNNRIQSRPGLNNVLDILFVHFDDVDKRPDGIKPEQAREILEFANKWWDKVDVLIVHCGAGQSRSAGCAAALGKISWNNDKFIFNNPRFTPNMLVYRTILEEYYNK